MKVEIYSKQVCPYCVRAKALLEAKHVYAIEYDITDPKKHEEMRQRTNGAQTVPQIFINDELIGGCDDLFALESSGQLNAKLGIKLKR